MLSRKPNPKNINVNAYDLVWSGSVIPQVDDIVQTSQWGSARVTGYFTEDGYLGVELDPIDPPEWWVKAMENGERNRKLMLFGAELRRPKEPQKIKVMNQGGQLS
jgi:hypothetical protein